MMTTTKWLKNPKAAVAETGYLEFSRAEYRRRGFFVRAAPGEKTGILLDVPGKVC